jgi:hypothetical protein
MFLNDPARAGQQHRDQLLREAARERLAREARAYRRGPVARLAQASVQIGEAWQTAARQARTALRAWFRGRQERRGEYPGDVPREA